MGNINSERWGHDMSGKDEKYYEKRIELLTSVSEIDDQVIRRTIRALSFVIKELNPGCFYNESYLNDFTREKFLPLLTKVRKKENAVNVLAELLSETGYKNRDISIIVDDFRNVSTPLHEEKREDRIELTELNSSQQRSLKTQSTLSQLTNNNVHLQIKVNDELQKLDKKDKLDLPLQKEVAKEWLDTLLEKEGGGRG